MKILHPETPAFWHLLKAFSSVSPGFSVTVNSVGFSSLPRALATQPFLAHTSNLHGALLPPRSQVLMASFIGSTLTIDVGIIDMVGADNAQALGEQIGGKMVGFEQISLYGGVGLLHNFSDDPTSRQS